MSLKQYRQKRPSATPEPEGKVRKSPSKKLAFVVQRHEARHLHFDFRIELHGVLKSWAIPKGPSMDPAEKRLAIEVEDHPLEYGKFQGTIPEGHYGAGTVAIWDRGTVDMDNCSTKKEAEAELDKQYKAGEIHFSLSGNKLKGSFVLIHLNHSQKHNQWLLIKSKHEKELPAKKVKPAKSDKPEKSRADKMPSKIKPMLATLASEPFDNEEWIFEVKWDGYRTIAEITPSTIKLYSRNLLSFNDRFPEIIDDLQKLKEHRLILDGEIVILDKNGVSQFQLLQNYLRHKPQNANLRYCVFDLLYLDGQDLRQTPLIERKASLKQLLEQAKLKLVVYSDHVETNGTKFYQEAAKYHLEGIMAKQKHSSYVSKRSRQWLKIKTHARQEVVIGGFTEPRGSRKHFGSLLMGVYDHKELKYVGHVGGGFDSKTLEEIYAKLMPLATDQCPFKHKPVPNTPVTWIKPKLVAEVSFQEWTEEGLMRQPIFQGLREDKKSNNVHREDSKPIPVASKKARSASKEPAVDEDFISNPDKVYWPDENYTKLDLLNYYSAVAKFILPHLKDRPIVLHRFPDGIQGEDFYQKEAPEHIPPWIQTAVVRHSDKNVNYMLANDHKSLLYIVNLGSIEIHPFLSRLEHLDYPDYAVMDLDPRGSPFSVVIDMALFLHDILKKVKLPGYCKTSGSKGLHIYIPTGGLFNYDFTLPLTQLLARILHSHFPKDTTLKRNPDMKQKKVYLDCLQNALSKTMAAPYSVRPTQKATVSTPLKWSEVKPGLDPEDFTIKSLVKRLEKTGDIFKPVLSHKKVNMEDSLKKLEKLFPNIK